MPSIAVGVPAAAGVPPPLAAARVCARTGVLGAGAAAAAATGVGAAAEDAGAGVDGIGADVAAGLAAALATANDYKEKEGR